MFQLNFCFISLLIEFSAKRRKILMYRMENILFYSLRYVLVHVKHQWLCKNTSFLNIFLMIPQKIWRMQTGYQPPILYNWIWDAYQVSRQRDRMRQKLMRGSCGKYSKLFWCKVVCNSLQYFPYCERHFNTIGQKLHVLVWGLSNRLQTIFFTYIWKWR